MVSHQSKLVLGSRTSMSPSSSASEVTYASVTPAMYTWPRASSRTYYIGVLGVGMVK